MSSDQSPPEEVHYWPANIDFDFPAFADEASAEKITEVPKVDAPTDALAEVEAEEADAATSPSASRGRKRARADERSPPRGDRIFRPNWPVVETSTLMDSGSTAVDLVRGVVLPRDRRMANELPAAVAYQDLAKTLIQSCALFRTIQDHHSEDQSEIERLKRLNEKKDKALTQLVADLEAEQATVRRLQEDKLQLSTALRTERTNRADEMRRGMETPAFQKMVKEVVSPLFLSFAAAGFRMAQDKLITAFPEHADAIKALPVKKEELQEKTKSLGEPPIHLRPDVLLWESLKPIRSGDSSSRPPLHPPTSGSVLSSPRGSLEYFEIFAKSGELPPDIRRMEEDIIDRRLAAEREASQMAERESSHAAERESSQTVEKKSSSRSSKGSRGSKGSKGSHGGQGSKGGPKKTE